MRNTGYCTLSFVTHMIAASLLIAFFGSVAGAQSPPIGEAGQVAELTASDGAANDSFGLSVAFSGNTIVAGAPGHAPNGAAYVFVSPPSGWANATQTAELTSTTASFNLGTSVATNGNTVVAGAPVVSNQVTSEADVFVEGGSGWADANQAATLTLSNAGIVDFGAATAVPTLGNFVLVGAPSTNPQGGFFGAVGAYKKPAAGWVSATQNKMFFPPFGSNPETYGSAIAISGSTVVITDPLGNSSAGAVYVYNLSGSTLTLVATLTASDAAADDELGTSVAIDGSTIVAGAINHAGVGAAYVFVEPATGWVNMTQTAELTIGNVAMGADLGQGVGIDGNQIVVGAPKVQVGSNLNQGAIFGYTKDGSWKNSTANFMLIAKDGAAGDHLGYSVAAQNGVSIGGAPNKNGNQGAVYVFGHP